MCLFFLDKESVTFFPRGTSQKSDPVMAWNSKFWIFVIHRHLLIGFICESLILIHIEPKSYLPSPPWKHPIYNGRTGTTLNTLILKWRKEWKAHRSHYSKAIWESCRWMLWGTPIPGVGKSSLIKSWFYSTGVHLYVPLCGFCSPLPPLHPPLTPKILPFPLPLWPLEVVGEYAFLQGCICFSTLFLPRFLVLKSTVFESPEGFHAILDSPGC